MGIILPKRKRTNKSAMGDGAMREGGSLLQMGKTAILFDNYGVKAQEREDADFPPLCSISIKGKISQMAGKRRKPILTGQGCRGIVFFRFVYDYGWGLAAWGLMGRRLIRASSHLTFIASFSSGGGATDYVRRLVADASPSSLMVVVSPTAIPGQLYCVCWREGRRIIRFFAKWSSLFQACGSHNVDSVVINELVSWERFIGEATMTVEGMGRIQEMFVAIHRSLGCPLRYLVHDYYSVCPRWTLMGSEKCYCRSEFTLEDCLGCLKADCPAYHYAGGVDIRKWRESFARFFDEVDEVRTFSNDSYKRMRRLYPGARLTLVPHRPAGPPLRKPHLRASGIVIGVFGRPWEIKGVEKVDQLEAYLAKIGRADVRIVRVAQYARQAMPDIIEQKGITIAFFPSVCPETFSYVTQELMEMGMPVVCYDLGAPAERISSYSKGLVISEMTPEATWRAIDSLSMRLHNE